MNRSVVWLGRVLWVAAAGLALLLLIGLVPMEFHSMLEPCSGEGIICDTSQLTAVGYAQLQAAGLSPAFYAGFKTALTVLTFVSLFAVALVLFWRRSDDKMSMFTAFVFVGMAISRPGQYVDTVWHVPLTLQGMIFIIPLMVWLTSFPNGRFVPRWTAIPAAIWALFFLVEPLLGRFIPELTYGVLWISLFSITLYAQVYRYRRVSGPVERQQTKWFMAGMAVTLLVLLMRSTDLLSKSAMGIDPGDQALSTMLWDLLFTFALMLWPVAIGIATLRYRLWDIDLLIRRTLVYSALTGFLALLYVGGVALLQALFVVVSGQQSPVAVVLSTLAIAAFFTPVRRRLQEFIDRRFYRRRYDAQQTLEAFGARMRDDLDLDQLRTEVLAAVEHTLEPVHLSLWLRHPAGSGGRDR